MLQKQALLSQQPYDCAFYHHVPVSSQLSVPARAAAHGLLLLQLQSSAALLFP
jgi:hypothetical protein